MIKVYCKVCKDKHFSHHKCSKCGYKFGLLWPNICKYGDSAKYCANCGHKFITNKVEHHDCTS